MESNRFLAFFEPDGKAREAALLTGGQRNETPESTFPERRAERDPRQVAGMFTADKFG
jgi:hypothetical protein